MAWSGKEINLVMQGILAVHSQSMALKNGDVSPDDDVSDINDNVITSTKKLNKMTRSSTSASVEA